MKIVVKAKPNAKERKIARIDDTHLAVWVKEPPVQGRANAAILRAVAEFYRVPPARVRLVSGYMSPSKIVEVDLSAEVR